jgi:hypothetical protein
MTEAEGLQIPRPQRKNPSRKPNRASIMTTSHELIKISPSVAASDLTIPAGFKEKK